MSNFTLNLGGADLTGAHFGNRTVNASRTLVGGNRIVHNVAGDQVNTTGAARPGCGAAQGVPDGPRPAVANQSNPPAAGTFDIKAQNAKMQGARFGDETEDHSVSVVLGKDITNNVSGNQYNRDQTAPRNADVPASAPASNAWQPPKEPSLQVGGNTPLQIAGGWYHWSWIPPAALAALDAGTGALASVVGRCCRALRVRLLAASAPAPHVCSSSPGL